MFVCLFLATSLQILKVCMLYLHSRGRFVVSGILWILRFCIFESLISSRSVYTVLQILTLGIVSAASWWCLLVVWHSHTWTLMVMVMVMMMTVMSVALSPRIVATAGADVSP